jgi:hypothetical protein
MATVHIGKKGGLKFVMRLSVLREVRGMTKTETELHRVAGN